MARIAPVGGWPMPMFKQGATRGRKAKSERGRQRDEAHLALIRQCPCISTGSMADVEAEHVYSKAEPGTSAKPSDEWVLPLTHAEHMRQHDIGETAFWSGLGIEPLKIAQQLYGISSALRASRAPEEEIVRHMTNIITRARSEERMGGAHG